MADGRVSNPLQAANKRVITRVAERSGMRVMDMPIVENIVAMIAVLQPKASITSHCGPILAIYRESVLPVKKPIFV